MARTRSAQRGFTLIELAVVLAIAAFLGTFMFGMINRPYGINATSASEQLASTLNYVRTRALTTRKIHRVEVHLELDPVEVRVWQAATSGMALTNFTGATPLFVERTVIPKSVTLYTAMAGAMTAGQVASPAQTTSEYDIDFLPDGSATASTIYVTDPALSRKYRVLVYHVTGSSYARQAW